MKTTGALFDIEFTPAPNVFISCSENMKTVSITFSKIRFLRERI